MTLYNYTTIHSHAVNNYYCVYTAVPIAPFCEQIMCNCDKYQQACITVLQVKVNKNDMLTQTRDTSNVNLVTLKLLEADVQQQLNKPKYQP